MSIIKLSFIPFIMARYNNRFFTKEEQQIFSIITSAVRLRIRIPFKYRVGFGKAHKIAFAMWVNKQLKQVAKELKSKALVELAKEGDAIIKKYF